MLSRPAVLAPALLLACAVVACGGSSDDRTVKDKAGRTCTVPSSGSLTIECDVQPMPKSACTGSASACFVTGVVDTTTTMIGPAAVCAACCDGNQSTSSEGDCSQIVCTTIDDCPLGTTECKDGGCF